MLRMLLEKSQEIMACALHIFALICMARCRWGWWGHELIQVETVDLGQSCLGSVGLGSCFHVFPILCSMTSWRAHCLWLSVAGESWQPHRRTSWVRELSCSIVLYCTNLDRNLSCHALPRFYKPDSHADPDRCRSWVLYYLILNARKWQLCEATWQAQAWSRKSFGAVLSSSLTLCHCCAFLFLHVSTIFSSIQVQLCTQFGTWLLQA